MPSIGLMDRVSSTSTGLRINRQPKRLKIRHRNILQISIFRSLCNLYNNAARVHRWSGCESACYSYGSSGKLVFVSGARTGQRRTGRAG
jgi:hypothetical protein